MHGRIRRVITGHDENGGAVVVADGIAPSLRTSPLRPGHISVDLWKTSRSPVVIGRNEPDPTQGPRQVHPPQHGTVSRITQFAPEPAEIRNMSPAQAREVYKSMGSAHASTADRGSRHPLMHRTETVDYAVVLLGEITMVLDDEDVLLRTGDVAIQRGTNHAWSNRSDKPCVMLFVLIDGKFDPALEKNLKDG